MQLKWRCFALFTLFSSAQILSAQTGHQAYFYLGTVYDQYLNPIPYAHVIARGTGVGDITDTSGIFQLYIRENDVLSFYHIAVQDTSIIVNKDDPSLYIVLHKKYYPLKEVRIFNWGSTYGEFMEEVKRLGVENTISSKLGLPEQDPYAIPFDMDEKAIKSTGFLLTSPISFLYYNLNKKEKSARKVYRMDRDSKLLDRFRKLVSPENIGSITGLSDEELESFMIFLNSRLTKNYRSPELETLSEIYSIWEQYITENKSFVE